MSGLHDATLGAQLRQKTMLDQEEAAYASRMKQARAELRDRFAIEALKILMPHAEVPNPVTARKAWQWADMMLEMRGDD